MEQEDPRQSQDEEQWPEDEPDEPGAEGGSKTARRSKLPPMPDPEDDTPVGDTDQHSQN